ncbi:hypothetical protein [Serratia fonticola]|uniref:hypothetical protein n=1 Tax=Serratia fonticola TaxID=47917 RepID=UPI0034C5CD75
MEGQSTDVHFSSLTAQRPHRSSTSCIFLRIRRDLIKHNLFCNSARRVAPVVSGTRCGLLFDIRNLQKITGSTL